MKISITGPSKLSSVEQVNPKARDIISEVARMVAKSDNEIVITPDNGSSTEFFAQEYKKRGGKRIWEVIPLDEEDYKNYLNIGLGEIISCGEWRNQPAKFNEESDLMICIGYGGLVMAEIGFSHYYRDKKVIIIRELVSGELPWEVGRSLKLEYVSYKELDKFLK